MIDVETPLRPGWWLARCARKLDDRLPRLEDLAARFEGNPPLPEGATAARAAYAAFQKKARLNLAEAMVLAISERLRVRAIRTAVDSGDDGDEIAWGLFRENGLEVEFADVLENMLALGDAYMINGLAGPRQPTMTGEDPRQVVTIHDPVRQSQIRAAAKFFHDPDYGMDYAFLFLPGRRWIARRPQAARPTGRVRFDARSWSWDETAGGADGEPTAGIMPVTRFRNRRGVGEFERHVDVLDRINHMILQRMVIATMQAFRQRAIKGDLPTTYPKGHPQEGEEIDYEGIFVADPGALWMIPAAAEIWESGQVDLQGILSAVQDDLKHLAAVKRLPFWIFAPDNQSASGADRANEGLVFAAEDRAARAGQGLAQVISKALMLAGETERARLDRITVDWFPVERHSLSAKGSAAQQAKAAGAPFRFIMEEIWQATPEQIRRAEADRLDDMMTALSGAQASTAVPTAG
ncbi:phage portal protein [Cellulomonas iranensis]|uniref:phage portal protein n=1 Tax=Cellulomonas iranensis TaxID=76862 RepID=UPI0013D0F5A4|nr:phage portal protein [Cellulomonas iranensis]